MTCETPYTAINDESPLELTPDPDTAKRLVRHLMTNQKPALRRRTAVCVCVYKRE